MAEDGYGLYFILGLFTGVFGFAMMMCAQKVAMRRSFKEYLFTLDSESRKVIDSGVQILFEKAEYLALKTNTRLMKSMYNDLLDFQSYLQRMWRQN